MSGACTVQYCIIEIVIITHRTVIHARIVRDETLDSDSASDDARATVVVPHNSTLRPRSRSRAMSTLAAARVVVVNARPAARSLARARSRRLRLGVRSFSRQNHRHDDDARLSTSASSSDATRERARGDRECIDRSRVGVGELHVITGPMFAGKTSALMSRAARARADGKRVFVVKSALDVERFGEAAREALIAHDGRTLRGEESGVGTARVRAVRERLGELSGDDLRACRRADVVAVDEAQFMPDLVEFVRHSVEVLGQVVYVAGLDGDFRREKFGGVLDLVPLCDTVTRLRGVCAKCGKESLFSQRVVREDGDGVVSVGGSDKYAPVCRACYVESSDWAAAPR